MEGAVIATCTLESKSVVLPILSTTTFKEVTTQLCSRFPELLVGRFELSYTQGNQSTCLLQTDMDIRMMHLLVSNERKMTVHITVERCWESPSTMITEPVLELRSFADEGSHSSNEDEYLENYAPPEAKIYLSSGWKEYISRPGQTFQGGVNDFRDKLRKYAAEMGFRFKYIKNDKLRVTAECTYKHEQGCNWRIHALLNQVNGYFYIKDLNNIHTCTTRFCGRKRVKLGSAIMSSVLADEVRSNPLVKPKDIIRDLKKNYGFDVSYHNAWYGKEIAKKEVLGDEALSYKQLVWYRRALLHTNPGTRFTLESDPNTSRFTRLFIAYNACIKGFDHCRPMLALDGTHLNNKYKGHLLAATGYNGNGGFFPLAFAIVDSENEDNWTWFLSELSQIVSGDRRITFLSDRNYGLRQSVRKIFPNSHHGFCLWHLQNNLRTKYPAAMGKTFKESIVKRFTKCAYAPTKDRFNYHMQKLKKIGKNKVDEFLEDLPYENWATAFFLGERYGNMCSNIAESFNSWISDERLMPVYQLVDGIRIKIMKMHASRKEMADEWRTCLCPTMETRLFKLEEGGRGWEVVQSSEHLFEVRAEYAVMVDLQNYTCSCGQWEANGFPCAHSIQAMNCSENNPFEYVDKYFSIESYKDSYAHPILPVPDIEKDIQVEEDEILLNPPRTRKPPGRPKTRRIRSSGEQVRQIMCGRCGELGNHNRQTCKAPI